MIIICIKYYIQIHITNFECKSKPSKEMLKLEIECQ